LELAGLALVAIGISDDRGKARALFGATTLRLSPARGYSSARLDLGTGGPEPTVEERIGRVEEQIARLGARLDDELQEARRRTDAQIDEAVEKLRGEMDKQDRELRGHLREVLVGGMRNRILGALLLGAGILFGVAANVLGSLS
jgi:hypothetical protein